MSNPIFWRLAWKEYRLQRAFWASMVLLTVVLQLIVLLFAGQSDPVPRTMWLFQVALVLSALYALGCGATLFATEHESGTYDFQRALPVSAARLFLSKVTFAVASTLAMIGLVWGSAAIVAGWRLPEPHAQFVQWSVWGFSAVELLVWGAFFSLLLKRPLVAAALAVTADVVSVSLQLIVVESVSRYLPEPHSVILPYRAVVAAIVATATIWLGCRWFRERIIALPAAGRFPPAETTADQSALARRAVYGSRGGLFRRLAWQHLRQSEAMLAVLSVVVALLLMTGIGLGICIAIDGRVRSVGPPFCFWLAACVWAGYMVPPLAGACVFLGDQRRHGFRFLAERGLEPRRVWLSRHAIWTAAALCWTLLTLPIALLLMASVSLPEGRFLLDLAGAMLGFVILAYAAGQLCSMFLSSGILAGFSSMALTVFLCMWAGLMNFLAVPWLWSVAPIPLVLLLATWLRTPHWLLERNTLKAWLPTALSLALPGLAILTAVCAYRVYSVPLVDPGFDPDEFARPATPDEQATAEMYRRAAGLYVPIRQPDAAGDEKRADVLSEPGSPLTEAEIAWLEENEAAIRLTLDATRRMACDFYDPTDKVFDARDLGRLLAASARRLESQGKLDAALERYLALLRLSAHVRNRTRFPEIGNFVERRVYECLPFWAVHPGQTAERIRAAIVRLERLQRDVPSPSDAVKSDYLRLERLLAGPPDVASHASELTPHEAFVIWAMQWLPWERARTERVLNVFTVRELESFDRVESAVLRNETFAFPDDPDLDPHWRTLERSTPWLEVFRCSRSHWLTRSFVALETRRRAVRVQLALAGWRIEHGRLPARLEELAGPFFQQVPLDPLTAGPFPYFPEGMPSPVYESHSSARAGSRDPLVPAGKPFFSSAGRGHAAFHADDDFVFEIPPGP